MKLDDIYTDTSLESAKDSLVDMASGMKNVGITVDDVTGKFPQLAAAAEQAGLEVQDVVDGINSEAGVVTGNNGLEDIVDRSQYTRFLKENKSIGTDMHTLGKISSGDGYSVGEISVTIPIEHVNDYNDFVNQLRDDKQFEQLIQDVTIGRIAGKNSLGKNKYKW